MRGASRIVMTARDQFSRLETLEKAFVSDSENGYRSKTKEKYSVYNDYDLFHF